MIFISFEPSMIDLNRTSTRAVHDLRHFIEFAQQGSKAITAAVRGSVGTYDWPFEQFVADGLRTKGWDTHPQIGVSRFRIDLGVVHRDRPGGYLVGVKCDVATYHSATTARDRDKVRSEILRGLGWHLVRVWPTAWWVDREGALEHLHEAISIELQRQRAQGRELTRFKDAEAAAVAKAAEVEGAAIAARDTNPSFVEDGLPMSDREAAEIRDVVRPEPYPLVARGRHEVRRAPVKRTYQKIDLSDIESSLQPESFQEVSYDATLGALIRRVLEQEAPILDKALVDQIARAHGFKRSGRVIRERVLELAERRYHFQLDPEQEHASFAWLTADDPGRSNIYRLPERDKDVRLIEELAAEEIVAAARSIKSDDPAVDIARMFAIRRLSAVAKDRIVKVTGRDCREPAERGD